VDLFAGRAEKYMQLPRTKNVRGIHYLGYLNSYTHKAFLNNFSGEKASAEKVIISCIT